MPTFAQEGRSSIGDQDETGECNVNRGIDEPVLFYLSLVGRGIGGVCNRCVVRVSRSFWDRTGVGSPP